MSTKEILEAMDAEIARLTKAKRFLGAGELPARAKKASSKRTVSAEGRARMAAAQKTRWAKRKRAAQ